VIANSATGAPRQAAPTDAFFVAASGGQPDETWACNATPGMLDGFTPAAALVGLAFVLPGETAWGEDRKGLTQRREAGERQP